MATMGVRPDVAPILLATAKRLCLRETGRIRDDLDVFCHEVVKEVGPSVATGGVRLDVRPDHLDVLLRHRLRSISRTESMRFPRKAGAGGSNESDGAVDDRPLLDSPP